MMAEAKRFYCDPGSPIKVKYSVKVKDDGDFDLVPVGEENVQDYIDSFAEESDINVIIARCAMGDTSALSKKQGMYGDFTEIPTTFRDIMQKVIDGKDLFERLPVDVRQKFDNSFEKWFTIAGSDEWYKNMGFVPKEDEKEVKGDA